MAIRFVVVGINPSIDPRQYVTQKIGKMFEGLPDADRDHLVESVLAVSRPVDVPLLPEEEHPTLTPDQQKSLDTKTSLFRRSVDRFSPLLDEETLLADDVVTALAAPFGTSHAYAPVLVRRTNFATLCYVYDNVLVSSADASVTYLDRAAPGEVVQGALGDQAVEKKAQELICALAKGLVGLIPTYGKIGVGLLELILPKGGIDYEQLTRDIGDIVRSANARTTLDDQAALLSAVRRGVHDSYTELVEGQQTPEEYRAHLRIQALDRLNEVIERLGRDDVRLDGIATYLSAVTFKFSVLQELNWTQVLHENAAEQVKEAESRLVEIRQLFDKDWRDRCAKVKVTIRLTDCPKSEWYVTDVLTGYRSGYFEQAGCNDDPERRAEAARIQYLLQTVRPGFMTSHHDQIGWMREVTNTWRLLAGMEVTEDPYLDGPAPDPC